MRTTIALTLVSALLAQPGLNAFDFDFDDDEFFTDKPVKPSDKNATHETEHNKRTSKTSRSPAMKGKGWAEPEEPTTTPRFYGPGTQILLFNMWCFLLIYQHLTALLRQPDPITREAIKHARLLGIFRCWYFASRLFNFHLYEPFESLATLAPYVLTFTGHSELMEPHGIEEHRTREDFKETVVRAMKLTLTTVINLFILINSSWVWLYTQDLVSTRPTQPFGSLSYCLQFVLASTYVMLAVWHWLRFFELERDRWMAPPDARRVMLRVPAFFCLLIQAVTMWFLPGSDAVFFIAEAAPLALISRLEPLHGVGGWRWEYDARGRPLPPRRDPAAASVDQAARRSELDEALRERAVRQACTLDNDCSICLESVAEGQMSLRLVCGHAFHDTCLRQWVSNSWRPQGAFCPMCKEPVTASSLKEE